jgi:UDP-glucose:(heptosyl)LPS alpha-1,3-glucosyltransferase
MATQSDSTVEHNCEQAGALVVAGEAEPCEVTIVAHDIGAVGGMERQLTQLVLGLRSLGHRVIVIGRTCNLPDGADVVFHRVPGPARPLPLAHPWFLLAGSLALRRWRRGVVQTTGAIVLNQVDVIAIHYCHQVGPANPSRSGPLYRLNALAARLVGRGAERICFRRDSPSRFACVSEGVAEEVREHFPQLADRVVTIHNGVDIETFAPGAHAEDARALRRELSIAEDRLVAAFVGGEWGRKGLEPLIRGLALAPEWDVVIAGSGDKRRYQELADTLGVGQAVHWIGVTRNVPAVYELADVFVFPSNYEAFPLVALEAAASGLPLLATPVSGVRELIQDGRAGFLIARDPTAIAERLRQLAADPDLRRRMGDAARNAAERFSWSAMVLKHHELYCRLRGASGDAT